MGFFKDFGGFALDPLDLSGKRAGKTRREGQKRIDEAKANQDSAEKVARDAQAAVDKGLQGGEKFARRIVGNGLSRAADDSGTQFVANRLRARAENPEAVSALKRSQVLGGLAGQEAAAQRSLNSTIARSGVRGGAAAASQLELANRAFDSRQRAEESLAIQDDAASRQSLQDYANFNSKLVQFDIAQEQKEILAKTQLELGYTNLLATERNSIRQRQAAELLALVEGTKSSGGGKGGGK